MLINPYRAEKSSDLVHLHTYIAKEDRELIRKCCPQQGALTLVTNNLIKAFCDELRKQPSQFWKTLEKRAS